MTVTNKKKTISKPFVSSREWAKERLVFVKQLQDEYLDQYITDKKESIVMLGLLSQLQTMLEKKLK
jgi:hypothetical protein